MQIRILSFPDKWHKGSQRENEKGIVAYTIELYQSNDPLFYKGYIVTIDTPLGEHHQIFYGRRIKKAAKSVASDLRKRGYPNFIVGTEYPNPPEHTNETLKSSFMTGTYNDFDPSIVELSSRIYPSQETLQKFHLFLDKELKIMTRGLDGLVHHYTDRIDALIDDFLDLLRTHKV